MNRLRTIRTIRFRTLRVLLVVLTFSAFAAGAQELGTWTELSPMPFSNAEFGGASVNGIIYLAGGFSDESAFLIYDPVLDSFRRGPDLPQGNHHPGVVAQRGVLYVIGGHDTEALVQIYDPATDSWSAGAEMPTPRRAQAVVELDGRIHVIGGTDNVGTGGGGLDTHEVYDPATDSWASLAPLLEAREHVYGGVIGGKIYIAAGRVGFYTPQDTLQIYDPETDSWSFGPPLLSATSGHAAKVVDDRLFVFGGELVFDGKVLRTTQRYDPTRRQWEEMAEMPLPLHGLGSAVVDGSIYLFGGATAIEADSTGRSSVFRFDPPAVPKVQVPKRLKAKVRSSTKVRLKWKFKHRKSDATSMEVEARLSGGFFEQVAEVPIDVKKAVLKRLERGGKYTFRVRAIGPAGPTEYSNERTVNLPD